MCKGNSAKETLHSEFDGFKHENGSTSSSPDVTMPMNMNNLWPCPLWYDYVFLPKVL